MGAGATTPIAHEIGRAAHPLVGREADFAPLLGRARHCSFVLIGEATHGTHEFY